MFTAEKTGVSRSFHRLLSRLYERTDVFSETPKRTRPLISSTLKGHEYGLLTFSVLLPFALDTLRNVSAGEWYVSEQVGEKARKQRDFRLFSRLYRRHTLLIYIFLARLYHYGDWQLDEAESKLEEKGLTLKDLHRLFYDGYQRGFCVKSADKARINVHTFSHLEQIRKRKGPLGRFSTEPFESLYAVMRRCYRTGTVNTSKQAMENFYMRDT